MVKKIIKNVFSLGISVCLAFLIGYYFLDDILSGYVSADFDIFPYLYLRLLLASTCFASIKWVFKESKKFYFDISFIIYSLFIIFITFLNRKFGGISYGVNFDLLKIFDESKRNIILNLIIYIPFGAYIQYRLRKSIKITLPLFILFISVMEFTQFITKAGFLDIIDMLLNTSGFLIGFLSMQYMRLMAQSR